MKRLSSHILSLLRRYDSVVLPGFGFFSLEYIPAEIDRESLSFMPPRFSLSFYKEEMPDDNLLLASYMKKDGLSETEGKSLLTSDISSLRERLTMNEEVALPGLGVFRTGDGNLYFDQCLAFNYGLPAISLATAEKVEQEPEKIIAEITQVENRRYKKPEYYYIPIHKKAARFAASFLLVLVVAAATFLPIGKFPASTSTAYISPVKVNYQAPSPNAVAPVVVEVPDEAECSLPEVEVPQTELETPAEVSMPTAEADRFFAVVAAFQSLSQVEKFINQYPDGGIAFEIIHNGKYNLITVASSVTKEALQDKMADIRGRFADAWIFEKK